KGEANFSHTARRIRSEDFVRFDVIRVMDRANLRDLERAFPAHSGKVRLLLEGLGFGTLEVPDPYYGDLADFEAVYATL
ncbi:low molecular weight phosphotyrosine protein phosphatase, partial [Vibrio parahaemolyticus]|nr:low molecular weight phosphotyrosine protein phosphatase [Vibrio parahaemolyticus]